MCMGIEWCFNRVVMGRLSEKAASEQRFREGERSVVGI